MDKPESNSEVRYAHVPGLPHCYLVGTDGSVWTNRGRGGHTVRWHPVKQLRNESGYCLVRVVDNHGKARSAFVHRLVLLAFVGEPPPGTHACHHPDPTPHNNRLENLRWDTPLENSRDRGRTNLPNRAFEDLVRVTPLGSAASDTGRLLSEQVIGFSEGAKLPTKPNARKLFRWSRYGVKQGDRYVVLESCRVGGEYCTTIEAFNRFIQAISPPRD